MNRPRRVAVTAPPEPGARPVPSRPAPEPALDPARAAAAHAARRGQLRRAALTLGCGAGLLFGLPVLLWLFPAAGTVRLLGVPVSWVAVALLPYPLLAGLAWWHLRGAERAERDADPDPEAEPDPDPAPDPDPGPGRPT